MDQLVDYLPAAGYEDIAVLYISKKAIDTARARGDKANKVKWNVSDQYI